MNILVAGDFCPQHRVARLFDEGKFADVLGEVKPIVEQADYAIVNFECPVTKEKGKPIVKCGPNLKCKENGLQAVRWAGFDCITLANNHFLDYGEDGVKDTLAVCGKYNIETVGGGLTLEEASKVLYVTIGTQKLAIISCCEHEFSIATETTAGSNPLNPIRQFYAINEAKKQADFVLVIVHGGHEHYQLPSIRMQETYRFFVDAGADAVVNHHQHCFSGYEVYNGKPIVYGLGNFCFDKQNKRRELWNEGYMVILDTDNLIDITIKPYTQCSDEPKVIMKNPFDFETRLKQLNEVIADYDKLHAHQEAYYSKTANNYSRILEPLDHRIYLALKRRGLLPSFISRKRHLIAQDYILCEAHLDRLKWYLEN